jgi:hypothetical protein
MTDKIREQKDTILECLKADHVGWNKSIRLDALAEKLGVDQPDVRKMIEQLQMEGSPIAYTGNQYFIPATANEALAIITGVRKRFVKYCKINKGITDGMQKLFPSDDRLSLDFGGIVLYPRAKV